MNEREIELDRRLENLKTALQAYVDYVEYIKRANAATKKRRHSKGPANNVFGDNEQIRRDSAAPERKP